MKLHDDHGSVQAAEKMTLKEALHVLRDGNCSHSNYTNHVKQLRYMNNI
jgi:hypothetical protein